MNWTSNITEAPKREFITFYYSSLVVVELRNKIEQLEDEIKQLKSKKDEKRRLKNANSTRK